MQWSWFHWSEVWDVRVLGVFFFKAPQTILMGSWGWGVSFLENTKRLKSSDVFCICLLLESFRKAVCSPLPLSVWTTLRKCTYRSSSSPVHLDNSKKTRRICKNSRCLSTTEPCEETKVQHSQHPGWVPCACWPPGAGACSTGGPAVACSRSLQGCVPAP